MLLFAAFFQSDNFTLFQGIARSAAPLENLPEGHFQRRSIFENSPLSRIQLGLVTNRRLTFDRLTYKRANTPAQMLAHMEPVVSLFCKLLSWLVSKPDDQSSQSVSQSPTNQLAS